MLKNRPLLIAFLAGALGISLLPSATANDEAGMIPVPPESMPEIAEDSVAAHAQGDIRSSDSPPSTEGYLYDGWAHDTGNLLPPWDDCTWVESPMTNRPGARVCFQKNGDKFWLKDDTADGYYVKMQGLVRAGGWHEYRCNTYATAADGWQVCSDYGGGRWYAHQIPENVTICFWAEMWTYRNGNWSLVSRGLTQTTCRKT